MTREQSTEPMTSAAEAGAGLIAKLEKAEGPSRELDALIALASGWTVHHGDNWIGPHGQIVVPAYTASLDAAMTLVPEGEWVELSGPRKYLNIPLPVPNHWRAEAGNIGWGATAPLALCTAALRARLLRNQGE
jgi:hypothetical protein